MRKTTALQAMAMTVSPSGVCEVSNDLVEGLDELRAELKLAPSKWPCLDGAIESTFPDLKYRYRNGGLIVGGILGLTAGAVVTYLLLR